VKAIGERDAFGLDGRVEPAELRAEIRLADVLDRAGRDRPTDVLYLP